MKRFLIFGAFLAVQLFFLSGCRGTKTVQLHNPDEVREDEVVRVRVPIDILVLDVDGRDVGDFFSYLSSYEKEIQIVPGEHEMTVRYSDFWDYDDSHFEKFRSAKVVLAFEAEAGRTYRVVHPRLKNIREAAEFEKNPEFWIEEEIGQTRVSTSRSEEGDKADPDILKAEAETSAVNSDDADDAPLEEDWDSLSEEEKKKFREWMEKRDKE